MGEALMYICGFLAFVFGLATLVLGLIACVMTGENPTLFTTAVFCGISTFFLGVISGIIYEVA